MASLTNMIETCGSIEKAKEYAISMISKGKNNEWLNLSLLYAAEGNYIESKKCDFEYLKYYPDCPRVKFGVGYHYLVEGDFQTGIRMINEGGRACNNFGNQPPQIGKLMWNGIDPLKGKKTLLFGEGGYGDEIINVRFAKNLSDRGASVIVSASESLLEVFSSIEGVNAVVKKQFLDSIYYDTWVPGMGAPWLCGITYNTLSGKPYIQKLQSNIWEKLIPKTKGCLNVGLRWSGLPQFEHEQFRKFPKELMLDLATVPNVKCFSFQRDTDLVKLPDNITDLSSIITTWKETALALSRMDIMISSCTSVAHMAAAMGIKTWIIVPIMAYYTWALPGNKSPWYESVTLFRQNKFGRWDDTLNLVKSELVKEIENE